MYKLYQGNSGKVRYVEEPRPQTRSVSAAPQRPAPPGQGTERPCRQERGSPPPKPKPAGLPGIGGIMEQLGGLLPKSVSQLETEDIILMLILYLMYRESGDSELLIIMGAMFLL